MTSNYIQFYSGERTEVLRLSRDGITANPEIPVNDAAKMVLAAIDKNIKTLVQKAVEAEREACAKVCEEIASSGENNDNWTITRDKAFHDCAAAIRARGQA